MDNKELSLLGDPAVGFEVGVMRRSEARDVARLFREIVDSLPYYNLEARKAEIAKYSPASLETYSTDDPESILVARCQEEVVGVCISRLDDTLIWLSWFLVSPSHRRMGIGIALVQALEASIRARGLHKIWCDCRTENFASKELLIGQGFLPLCTVLNHWYGQDFILWEKSL